MMVIANDQAFGKSRIGYLDYAMSIFRAVEIRRPLARVTNTGPSAAAGADGVPLPGTPTPPFKAASVAVEPVIPEVLTLYGRISDAFLYLCYLTAAAYILFRVFRRHREYV